MDHRLALQTALKNSNNVNLLDIDPFPKTTNWTLSPETLKFLVSLVPLLKPQHILEFGSGLSTRVLAWACGSIKSPCSITSVDHDPEFSQAAASELSKQKVKCSVTYNFAPLIARECAGKTMPMYKLDEIRLASSQPADLIVIDGPPNCLGGREGTLYQAMTFSRPGTLVLLDDANRSDEKQAVTMWQDTFDEAIEVNFLPGFTRGLAAITISEPVLIGNLSSYLLQHLTEVLKDLISSGSKFVLVDENFWWGKEILPDCSRIDFLGDSEYSGVPPLDDKTAIRELEQRRQSGVRYIIFTWSAFWWLEYYKEFHSHLRSNYNCLIENKRFVVFGL